MGINRQSVQLHKILVDVLQQPAESHISYTPSSAHGLQHDLIISYLPSSQLISVVHYFQATGLPRYSALALGGPTSGICNDSHLRPACHRWRHVYEISITGSQIKLHIETWTKKKQLSSTERSER